MWGFFGYIPGIPILSIMVRYNLLSSGVVGSTGAFFWAVLAPWVLTAFTYQAQVLVQFCNLVAVFCQGFINLVVPVMLYRAALQAYPTPDELHRSAGASSPAATGAAASAVVHRQGLPQALLAAVCGVFSGSCSRSDGSSGTNSKWQRESASPIFKESSGAVPVGGPLPLARSTLAVIRSLLCAWQRGTCGDCEGEQKPAQSPAVTPATPHLSQEHAPLSPPLLVSHGGRDEGEVKEQRGGTMHAQALSSVRERDEYGGNQDVQVAMGGEEDEDGDVKESHVDALPSWLIPDHRTFSSFFLWSLVAVVIAGIVSSLMF